MNPAARLLPIFLALILFSTSCAKKQPSNQLEAIKSTGIMRVVTNSANPPFTYIGQSGKLTGFDIDMAVEAGKRMGLAIEFTDMPLQPLIQQVQGGKSDIAVAALKYSADFDMVVDFTDPYLYISEDKIMAPGPEHVEHTANNLYIIVPEGEFQLAGELNKVIISMIEDVFMEELVVKYFLPDQ